MGRGPEAVYLWRARPSWIRRVLTNVLSCLTCGLLAPLFFVRNLKETLSQVHFGGKQVQFTSHTDEYVERVWGPSVLYNLLSCCAYSLCGCAEVSERGFVDIHLVSPSVSPFTSQQPAAPWSGQGSEFHPAPPVPVMSSHEQSPLLGDRPPPYQYGPSYNP